MEDLPMKPKKSLAIAGTTVFILFLFTLTVQAQQADVLKTKCEEFSGYFMVDAAVLDKYVSPDIKVAKIGSKARIRFYVMSNCESVSLNGVDINSASKDFGLATLAVDTQGPVGPAKAAMIDGAEFNMLVRYNYTLWSWVSGSKRDQLISSFKETKISAIPTQTIEINRYDNLTEGRLVEIGKKPITWTENFSNPSFGRMKVGVQIDFFNGDQKMMVECLWPLDKEGDFNLEAPETEFATISGKQVKGSISGHTFKNDCTITLDGVK
jgi:hypothetical protein